MSAWVGHSYPAEPHRSGAFLHSAPTAQARCPHGAQPYLSNPVTPLKTPYHQERYLHKAKTNRNPAFLVGNIICSNSLPKCLN